MPRCAERRSCCRGEGSLLAMSVGYIVGTALSSVAQRPAPPLHAGNVPAVVMDNGAVR